ncbi:MAG TPA: MraY family glycosyltransferase [Verrucomicrobiae bacterium]|nr:MraY family glycosyltransferase [Verrucomicrobiae bacterium]
MEVSHLFAATLGLVLSVGLIPLALWAEHRAILGERPAEWHHGEARAVPRLGGAVLMIVFLVIEFWISLTGAEARDATPGRNAVVFASVAMFALGFWDDIRPIGAVEKLAGQICIAAAVWWSGVGIEVISVPFCGCTLNPGMFAPVLTIVWLVGLTNLVNLMDGADGLAGGLCFALMLLVAQVGHQQGNFEVLACGMAGALLGFLRFNFPPARIYLGDGGAYFLGFQIGLYSIVNSSKGAELTALAAPLLVLALPISDALATLLRRGILGLPLFRPDRRHLHHRLIESGCSHRRMTVRMYGLYALFLGMGYAAVWSHGKWLPSLAGAAIVALLVCAGANRFSRRWFSVHRVIRDGLKTRADVRHALCLSQSLQFTATRCSSANELWRDLVSAARKLGFISIQLTLNGEVKTWGSRNCGEVFYRRFVCPNRQHGFLDLGTRAGVPLGTQSKVSGVELSNQRSSELVGELLAEAWDKAAERLEGRGIELAFVCGISSALKRRNPDCQSDLEQLPNLAAQPPLK